MTSVGQPKKLAAFVEGRTEQVFLRQFLIEQGKNFRVDLNEAKLSDPQTSQQIVTRLTSNQSNGSTASHQVLILNVSGDGGVVSRLCENHAHLDSQGFQYIFGMRDLHPFHGSHATKMRRGHRKTTRQRASGARILFAHHEIEAWFISDHTHFSRIDSRLTCDRIQQSTGFDPLLDDAQTVKEPALLLSDCYRLVSMGWTKRENQIQRTVNSLDIDWLVTNRRESLRGFRLLCKISQGFFC